MPGPHAGMVVALILGGILLSPATAPASDTRRAASELRAQFAADLEQLTKWCETNGLNDEARATRRVLGPSNPYKLYLPVLPDEIGPTKPPADAPEKVVEWDSRLTKLRRDHAVALYKMAQSAVRNGKAGLAFELVMAAIHANPDFEPVRKMLGYQKYHDQWRTFYAAKKLRDGSVWSDKFGWLPKSYLPRYEDGQRNLDGRWVSAAEDADHHRDVNHGWHVETEHYSIHTDDSLEAGVALGVKLECLNRLWQQIFLGYYASEADVVAWFDGRSRPQTGPLKRHEVLYFRDRDDYNRSLKPAVPNIEISIGLYFGRTRQAFFFAGKDSDDETLYHEATHQLFYETRPVSPEPGSKFNFWVVEGIALYMESLRQEDGYYVLGGFDTQRLADAKYRLLEDNFYVPLQEFAGYGTEKIQTSPVIGKLYSQAAGLTHFLIHYDGGRYRDALIAYLTAIYTGRDQPDTLVKLTGTSFADLDKQYREFIESGKQRAAAQ